MDGSSISYAVSTGVVSGVLSAALLWLVGYLWFNVCTPWLDNRLYKGVLLDGKWQGARNAYREKETDGNIERELIHRLELLLELEQHGYKISGIFRAKAIDPENRDVYENLYKISGHVSDNFVILEYTPVSRKRAGLGTFVLNVKNGGRRMHGSISFVEEGDMEVESLRGVILNRIEE